MSSPRKKRKLSDDKLEKVALNSQVSKEEAENAPSKDQRRSLFVRSLPASLTTEKFAEHFSQHFPIKHATVIVDKETRISKGYGFVTFVDVEDAQAAATQFNNSFLEGRKIHVEVAESRQRELEENGRSGINATGVKLRAERAQNQTETQAPRLIVRNLPWSIKEPEDLSLLFRSYGKVKHAVIPKRESNMQYGFGIVLLRGRKNAEKAIAGVNGKEVDGRTLAVDWAVDKKTWEDMQKNEANEMPPPGAAIPEFEEMDTEKDNAEADNEDDSVQSDLSAEDSDAELEKKSDQVSDTDPTEEDFMELDIESDGSISAVDTSKTLNDNSTTVFIRNLPFTVDDQSLLEHFRNFGPVRYARVVYDNENDRSRGTGFVCFFQEDDAKACVKNAPKQEGSKSVAGNDRTRNPTSSTYSVLQNTFSDPTGRYTVEGRVLQVSRALEKSEAERRANEANDKRDKSDGDRRRLYLLAEGTVPKESKLYNQLGKAEIDIRESSARQRQKLIKSNPNLGLSLTRLSVRNIPRNIGSKDLKALAREAVVGFAKDTQAGIRQPLNKEELGRDRADMREAEKVRKSKGVGIVKQAKVVFEGSEGGKVKEGAGRSRGYGFIEYYTHRNALAGLRWLNGHTVKASSQDGERARKIIVEFAIENAQVVQRRDEREKRSRDGPVRRDRTKATEATRSNGSAKKRKRKQESQSEVENDTAQSKDNTAADVPESADQEKKNRLAKRNRIISKKRHARKVRKGGRS